MTDGFELPQPERQGISELNAIYEKWIDKNKIPYELIPQLRTLVTKVNQGKSGPGWSLLDVALHDIETGQFDKELPQEQVAHDLAEDIDALIRGKSS